MTRGRMFRDRTESGDWYTGTDAAWTEYWVAVNNGNLGVVEYLESGGNDDFYYDPKEGTN